MLPEIPAGWVQIRAGLSEIDDMALDTWRNRWMDVGEAMANMPAAYFRVLIRKHSEVRSCEPGCKICADEASAFLDP